MSLNVKKGDNVKILAGKDKGKSGRITAVNVDAGRVVVENCNIITKHVKARSAQAQSSIQKIAGTIDVSNVQIICPACSKTTRVANTIVGDKKQRTCKKCNGSLDVKAKAPEKKTAKKVKKADSEEATTEKKTATKKAPAKKTTTAAKSDKE